MAAVTVGGSDYGGWGKGVPVWIRGRVADCVEDEGGGGVDGGGCEDCECCLVARDEDGV